MKNELAESILKDTMEHWDTIRLTKEINDIQIISGIKYDDYQQYTHGMRYIESLALWLRQFDSIEEKEKAYNLIKEKLIYISEEEMRQLIMFSFPMIMKKYLLEKTKSFCVKNNIMELEERRKIYHYYMRSSLFLGLSDGSHIDFFRRHNSELSNEQVFVHYDFSENKASDMLNELNEDLLVREIKNKHMHNSDVKFESFFLIDDFTGSGKSYIRKSDKGWKGKINAFYERLKKVGYDLENIEIHLVLYIATKKSLRYIKEQAKEYAVEKGIREITIDAIQVVYPIDWENNKELSQLLEGNYGKNIKLGRKTFVDKHFNVGEGNHPYYGFGDCSLPLVLYHNTPNNSLPILWYSWGNEVDALFLRVTRHK